MALAAGDKVRVTGGPFEGCAATVQLIDLEKCRLKVTVRLYGRETPVEVDIWQVQMLERRWRRRASLA